MWLRIKESCTCKLKCQFWSACSQMYSCTCPDACTNTTVCKHMHMQNHPQKVTQTLSTNVESLAHYIKVSVTSFPATSSPLSRDILMKRIQKRNHQYWYSMQCLYRYQYSREHLGTALEQFSHTTKDQLSGNRKRNPSHMKSDTQPRFFSTRKKEDSG